ncbi:MAG: (Fe-S)-binding protein [Flavobacteriales bacterium]|nr:(Fe-S)-binding protein [Flavobacteriales bacterium]
MISSIVFILVFGTAFTLFIMKVLKIRRNILLGKDAVLEGTPAARLKTMAMVALGQSKMVVRPVAGILHIFIYLAFVFTQVELIEIIVDGITNGHRSIWQLLENTALSGIYTLGINLIEILSILAFIATIVFLSRRNILRLARFQKPELKGWPSRDANIILLGEIFLIACIMLMNSTDVALQRLGETHATGTFFVSNALSDIWAGTNVHTLHLLERIGWWGHLLGILGFMVYLPYSKHFHILLAFPNTYYTNLKPKGKFTNLEAVTKEVKLMMDPSADPYAAPADPNAAPVKFGARDVTDLTWKNLMDAYTCTECGRCTSECPANQTGKLLSPRKIMMDTRDRLEEVGRNIDKHGKDYNDGKSLLGNYITEEELWACTSCNACVQACPVNINPLEIILELRRDLVMEQSKAPASLNAMFTNVENNGAPWQFSPMDRANWINEL